MTTFTTRIRTCIVAILAALLVASLAGSAGAASKPQKSTGPDQAPEVLDAQIAAYERVYPNITPQQARLAAEQQKDRKALYTELTADGGDSFGGAWFEPTTGVLNVAVTNRGAAQRVEDSARAKGIITTTHIVRRSVKDLQRQADSLRKGGDVLGDAAQGQVGFDVKTNQVVVAVPADQKANLAKKGLPDGVTLVTDPDIDTEADYGCTSRSACDYTIRAGSMLWRGSAGNNVCSVGFTGRDSSNRRYVLTAGHCSNGNNVNWGTGTASIGPMYASINSGVYDAAIIRVTNSWFAYDTGGEIYQTAKVNYVAPTLSYIWAGDSVCLSANYTNPTGGNLCGVVGTNSDAAVRGMVRVNGLDACGGDSGGGWYWLSGSTYRVAYGLHSRSDTGCHGSQGGTRSWFSPLPTIKQNWAPWLKVETRA